MHITTYFIMFMECLPFACDNPKYGSRLVHIPNDKWSIFQNIICLKMCF